MIFAQINYCFLKPYKVICLENCEIINFVEHSVWSELSLFISEFGGLPLYLTNTLFYETHHQLRPESRLFGQNPSGSGLSLISLTSTSPVDCRPVILGGGISLGAWFLYLLPLLKTSSLCFLPHSSFPIMSLR